MKKRKLIKFILLMGILLAISVPQQYAHAQDCDPATGAVCPPDPQSNPPQDNDEKEKKKTPTTMPATPTYTLQPPTSTATYTPQPPTSTATFTPFPPSPTSILVEAALPQAEPGNNSGAGAGTPFIFGILGGIIIIGMVWFAIRAFGDGSVRNKSTSGPSDITDGTKQGFNGGSTGDMGDGSVRENALINEQVHDAKGNENFAKLESSGETNFMKEVRDSDNSFGDSLLDSGSGNKTKI